MLDTIYERDRLVSLTPGVVIGIDPGELDRYRAPFRLLAWFLQERGYSMLEDLIGEDRPQEVAEFYRREWEWLRA